MIVFRRFLAPEIEELSLEKHFDEPGSSLILARKLRVIYNRL